MLSSGSSGWDWAKLTAFFDHQDLRVIGLAVDEGTEAFQFVFITQGCFPFTFVTADQEIDLGMREADVAIRMSPPRQPDLIQRPLMTFRQRVYAATEYLEMRGVPERPEDLDSHDLIIFGDDSPHPVSTINWLLHAGENPDIRRRPILQVNNLYGIYRAARSGLGLAALSEFMIPENSNLMQVLPELEGPATQAYFVYPEELRNSACVIVFRDFLIANARRWNF